MRATARSLLLLGAAALLAACTGQPINGKLPAFDGTSGYRFDKLSLDNNTNDLFVILAFSGGGTRAAAFSFGVMEGLRETKYQAPAGQRALLEDVDVISSVSGGSFTAAYYGLFRDRLFTDFPNVFLYRSIQTDLVLRALSPINWVRLGSPTFDRIDLAAELYDEVVFEHKTFADLLSLPRKPYIVLNATDMTLGHRFEFTQDQFDLRTASPPRPPSRACSARSRSRTSRRKGAATRLRSGFWTRRYRAARCRATSGLGMPSPIRIPRPAARMCTCSTAVSLTTSVSAAPTLPSAATPVPGACSPRSTRDPSGAWS
jgi:hypothetical protein